MGVEERVHLETSEMLLLQRQRVSGENGLYTVKRTDELPSGVYLRFIAYERTNGDGAAVMGVCASADPLYAMQVWRDMNTFFENEGMETVGKRSVLGGGEFQVTPESIKLARGSPVFGSPDGKIDVEGIVGRFVQEKMPGYSGKMDGRYTR